MRLRNLLFGAALAGVLFNPVPAHAQEPQPVPEEACNQGTADARTNAPEPADSGIPHERRTGECHHLVPSGG